MKHTLLKPAEGMRQYLATPGLNETIVQNQAAILAAGKNKLAAYCEMFPRTTDQPKAEPVKVATYRERLLALIGRAEDEGQIEVADLIALADEEDAKPKARKRNAKPKAFGVGTKFSYAGQNGTSKWEVVSDDATTKKSKQPAFMCLRDGASEPRAWSKSQIERKLADGTISL